VKKTSITALTTGWGSKRKVKSLRREKPKSKKNPVGTTTCRNWTVSNTFHRNTSLGSKTAMLRKKGMRPSVVNLLSAFWWVGGEWPLEARGGNPKLSKKTKRRNHQLWHTENSEKLEGPLPTTTWDKTAGRGATGVKTARPHTNRGAPESVGQPISKYAKNGARPMGPETNKTPPRKTGKK